MAGIRLQPCQFTYSMQICLSITMSFYILVHGGRGITSYFTLDPLSNVKALIDFKCGKAAGQTRDVALCIQLCNVDDACTAASLSAENHCFLHNVCAKSPKPQLHPDSFRYFLKRKVYPRCINGGTWISEDKKCKCINGWVGPYCSQMAHNCQDLIEAGYEDGTQRANLDIFGNGSKIIPTYCYIDRSTSFSHIYVFSNAKGWVNFNKTWNEYVHGFNDRFRGLWVGLEQMHMLTLAGYTTLQVLVLNYVHPAKTIWQYENFRTADASQGYSFDFESKFKFIDGVGSSFEFGDCLSSIQNTPFSTWDSDNDLETEENCAAWRGSGWWFKNCDTACNPMGNKATLVLPNADASEITDKYWSVEFNLLTPDALKQTEK